MKDKVLHAITFLLKLLSVVMMLLQAAGQTENSALYGVLLFAFVSSAKDLLIALGDRLDNGKADGSFKYPVIAMALLCGLCALSLSACGDVNLPPVTVTTKDGNSFHYGPDGIHVDASKGGNKVVIGK